MSPATPSQSPSSSSDAIGFDGLNSLFGELASSPDGLNSNEAKSRLAQYGPNALAEKQENPLLKFLGYFWGPIPWMIEVAAAALRRRRRLGGFHHHPRVCWRSMPWWASGRNTRPPTPSRRSRSNSP